MTRQLKHTFSEPDRAVGTYLSAIHFGNNSFYLIRTTYRRENNMLISVDTQSGPEE